MEIKYVSKQSLSHLINKCKATFASIAHAHTSLLAEDLMNVACSLDDLTLSEGTPHVKYYCCKSNGGGSNITGRPDDTVLKAFNLKVELIRYASSTDYITKQTYNLGEGKETWVRYCTSGTWESWKKILDSNNYSNYAAKASHNHGLSNITSGSLTVGKANKTLNGSSSINFSLKDIGADPLISGYYGSDTANTAGWYKVCTVSQTGYSDYSLNLMITSGYSDINSGILHVHTRCDSKTAITVKANKWLVRYGWNVGDAVIVTGDNTWSLYIYRKAAQHGRIQVKVLSKSGTTSDTDFELTNNTTVETTVPSGTVSTDGGVVETANSSTTSSKLSSSAGSLTQPVYFEGGIPKACTYTLGKSVPSDAKFTDTNTTYSAGTGISLSGTTFSNSGVRSISTGSSNGTISVNTNGASANVSVKGLGSAAYTATSAYLGSSGDQTLTGGSFIIPDSSTSNTYRAKRTVDNVVSQADLYISENGNPRLRFNSGGSTVNYLSLQSDGTVLGQPLMLGSGGTGATTASAARSNLGIVCTSLYSGTLKSGSCSFTYGGYNAYIIVGKPSTESYGIVSLYVPASYITSSRTMQLADNLYYFLFDIVGSGTTGTITIGTNNNGGHIAKVYGVN